MVGTAGKTKNYTITYVAGTLTINKATLPDDPDDPSETRYDVSTPQNHVYDGQEHKENITVTDNALPGANKDITDSFDITYDTNDFVNVKTITITITAKKGSNYEGTFTRTYQITPAPLTITADDKTKVYGDRDPQLTATVTGLVKGDSVDYTLTRDAGEDVGSYVIHVSVPQQKAKTGFFARLLKGASANANYTIKTVNGTFRITPAPLTITTGSASKVYDGTSLTNNTVSVNGLKRGDSITVAANGSQTAVGSSRNTYTIVWDKAKASNYTVTENLGTLTVTAAPTPTPTPTPTPGGGGTVTPTPNIVPTPAEPEVEPEVVPDEPTPEVTPEPEPIEPEPTPVAPPAGAWALINLLCAIGSALLSIINLILYFTGKKDDEDDDNNGEQTAAEGGAEEDDENKKELKRKGLVKLLSLIPGIGSIIVFFLTEDMSLPMVMVDKWTILMVILLVVTIVMAVLSKKTKKDADKEEEQTQTQA